MSASPEPPATTPDTPAPPPRGGIDRRKLLGLVAGLAVLGFVAWIFARDWDKVSGHDWRFSPGWILLGVALMTASYVGTGVAYAEIVRRLQPSAAPARTLLVSIWGRSLLGRYVPGSVLMVLGRTELGRRAGVQRRVSLAATVYELAIVLASCAITGIVFVAVYGSEYSVAPFALVLVPLLLVPLHPRIFRRLTAWALAKVRREPLEVELTARQVAALVGLYTCTSLALGASAWALVRGAAGPSGDLVYVTLGFLFAFTLSTLAIVLPAGLGVRDGAFALVLGRDLASGVAAAASVGLRLVTIVFEVAFVLVVTWLGRGPTRAVVPEPT